MCAFWAETLQHLGLRSNLVISPCLITLSDNLYLVNNEETQRINVSHLCFQSRFYLSLIMKVIPHIVLKDDHSSHRLWVRVGGMKGSLINVFFSRKPRSYSFTPQLMSTPEGFPYGEGEHSLMGMIPRSISFWTSNGFSLLVFASVVELLISGERCAFLAAVIRNFCEACKSLYGSVRAEWLGNRL